MEYKQVQSLIKDFEKSELTILELEFDGVKLKLSKQSTPALVGTPLEPSVGVTNQASASTQWVPPSDPSLAFTPIKSPLVGTYYAASAPGNPPFVTVGQKVKKGQVICIIEAMKIMNEITSPYDGIIEKIEPKGGDAIGFDQVLMLVNQGA